MRILYFDIDSLRPDHLGCYGYHRATSPNIDRLAEEGVRFEDVWASDAPCLPSRTAMWSGRFGIHNGVTNHGGTAAQPFPQPDRWVTDVFHDTGWMMALRSAGLDTITISSFAERHSAWHWYAGYKEVHNCGREGMERADEVAPIAIDWIRRHGKRDDWFLHVNLWDPHIPYRTPLAYGNPFEDEPIPAWMTEEVWRRAWEGFGPHSPQEPHGYGGETFFRGYPRFPESIDSMEAVKTWFDGYDVGIRYTDDHIGYILEELDRQGVLDETVVIVSADHGESQGEFNVFGDHQTADRSTCRIPLVVRWPGMTEGRIDRALHYHVDFAATLIEGVGGTVPANWDGRSFWEAFESGKAEGREYLVVSQGAHIVQRGIRFEHDGTPYLCLWTLDPGYKMIEPVMLFDLEADPYEQHDLAGSRPSVADRALRHLAEWTRECALKSGTDRDPLLTSLKEGPLHASGKLDEYVTRLRATGRAEHVAMLRSRTPKEGK